MAFRLLGNVCLMYWIRWRQSFLRSSSQIHFESDVRFLILAAHCRTSPMLRQRWWTGPPHGLDQCRQLRRPITQPEESDNFMFWLWLLKPLFSEFLCVSFSLFFFFPSSTGLSNGNWAGLCLCRAFWPCQQASILRLISGNECASVIEGYFRLWKCSWCDVVGL